MAAACAAVRLVGFYWNVEVVHARLAVTGEATLCGAVGGVGGLRAKALAAFKYLSTAEHDACLLLPADNSRGSLVVENPSAFDQAAAAQVCGWQPLACLHLSLCCPSAGAADGAGRGRVAQ